MLELGGILYYLVLLDMFIPNLPREPVSSYFDRMSVVLVCYDYFTTAVLVKMYQDPLDRNNV